MQYLLVECTYQYTANINIHALPFCIWLFFASQAKIHTLLPFAIFVAALVGVVVVVVVDASANTVAVIVMIMPFSLPLSVFFYICRRNRYESLFPKHKDFNIHIIYIMCVTLKGKTFLSNYRFSNAIETVQKKQNSISSR